MSSLSTEHALDWGFIRIKEMTMNLTGFYPSSKILLVLCSCEQLSKLHTIYQSTYFIEYFMQGNFKYPRIKKIHQILEKIPRFYQKMKIFVSCIHMNCCLHKYTIHQFTYFIYCLFQDKFKHPKIIKIQQIHQKIHTKQFSILYKLFSTFEFKVTQEMRLI